MLRRPNLLHLALRQQALVLIPTHRRLAGLDFLHGDALLDRAHQAAHVTTDATVLLNGVDVDRTAARARQEFDAARAAYLRMTAVRPDELAHGQRLPAD